MRPVFLSAQKFAVFLFVLLLAGCSGSSDSGPAVTVGAAAPDFTLVNMDGEKVSLSDFHGQVVVINFWATWCPPCREEKPTMEHIYTTFKDEGLVILAVNVEENGHQVVSQYLMSNDYSFPILLDSKAVLQRLYGVYRFPESFVIDRDGVVVERIIGGRDWMRNPTYRLIESLVRS